MTIAADRTGKAAGHRAFLSDPSAHIENSTAGPTEVAAAGLAYFASKHTRFRYEGLGAGRAAPRGGVAPGGAPATPQERDRDRSQRSRSLVPGGQPNETSDLSKPGAGSRRLAWRISRAGGIARCDGEQIPREARTRPQTFF